MQNALSMPKTRSRNVYFLLSFSLRRLFYFFVDFVEWVHILTFKFINFKISFVFYKFGKIKWHVSACKFFFLSLTEDWVKSGIILLNTPTSQRCNKSLNSSPAASLQNHRQWRIGQDFCRVWLLQESYNRRSAFSSEQGCWTAGGPRYRALTRSELDWQLRFFLS